MIQLLRRLQRLLVNTCYNHKKKIIFVVILTLGYQIAKRKIKTEHLISFVMFFVKFSSKVVEMLPLPVDPELRHKQQFRFIQEKPIEEMKQLVNVKQILLKVKNKQEDISSLKKAVLSYSILNIVLYKMITIYELFQRKYKADFEDLGAGEVFFQTILQMKKQFIENLQNFRHFVLSEISNQIEGLNLSAEYGYDDCEKLFRKLFEKIFSQQLNIKQKILGKKTYAASSQQYKVASNYFRSNKQYIQEKQSYLTKGLKLLVKPATFLLRLPFSVLGSTIFKEPQVQTTNERFCLSQMLYVLPLKKFQNKQVWPNAQSKHLYEMVQQQIINFVYSINFNTVSYRKAELNLQIFLNRLNIYFINRASNKKQKLLKLTSIFYRIIEQELIPNHESKKAYYEKQIFSALKDTTRLDNLILSQMKLRSKALEEFYTRNQVQHLQKDMQVKIYNERQGIVIQSTRKAQKQLQGKDDILELMNIAQNADRQNENAREGLNMVRELTS